MAGTTPEGLAYLAANREKEGVVTLPSGLQYKVLLCISFFLIHFPILFMLALSRSLTNKTVRQVILVASLLFISLLFAQGS